MKRAIRGCRRMFDLALGEADDMPAAQRAIGLASSPVVMMERLIEHLLENFGSPKRFGGPGAGAGGTTRACSRRWSFGEDARAGFSKVQDLSAAERAIRLADDSKQPLIEALIVYLRENQERDPALDWMQELARSLQIPPRRPLLTDLVDYALLTPRFSAVEDAHRIGG